MNGDIVCLGYEWRFRSDEVWTTESNFENKYDYPVYIKLYGNYKYVVLIAPNVEGCSSMQVICTVKGLNHIDLIYLFSIIRDWIETGILGTNLHIGDIMEDVYYIEHDEDWIFKGVGMDG